MEETPSLADEAARTDLSCAGDGDTGEAQRFGLLGATCLLGVALAAHIGCNRLVLEALCPSGMQKTIVDTWDKRQRLTVDCDLLHELVCGAGAVAAEEMMRTACGLAP